MAVSIMLSAVCVIDRVARGKLRTAISAVVQTLRIVADFVAHAVHE